MMGESRRGRSGECVHAFFVEDLIPKDHILRRIDAVLDTSWVREEVASCYVAGRGRASCDPEVIVRMMLLGFLYGLSEKRLVEEMGMHLGYRWFCHLQPSDSIPDRTTLVKLRCERWEQALWREILEKSVEACMAAGLVSGRHVAIDGTQIEANAAIGSLEPIAPPLSLEEHLLRNHGWVKFVPERKDEPPGPPRGDEPRPGGSPDFRGAKLANATHRSRTDPEARLYRKSDGQGAKLSYLAHVCVDTKSRVILAGMASEASTKAEWEAGEVLLDDAKALVGDRLEVVSADKGYGVGRFLAAVVRRGLTPHIPVQGAREVQPVPAGCWPRRRLVKLSWARQARQRAAEVAARNRALRAATTRAYRISRRLRIRVEHLIGEGKTCHRLGRAWGRGVVTVDRQAVLTFAVQNLKRLALWRGRRIAQATALHPPITRTPCARDLSARLGHPISALLITLARLLTPPLPAPA